MSTDVLSLIKAADVSGFIANIGSVKSEDDFQPLITAAMISGSTDCLQAVLSAGKSLGNISLKMVQSAATEAFQTLMLSGSESMLGIITQHYLKGIEHSPRAEVVVTASALRNQLPRILILHENTKGNMDYLLAYKVCLAFQLDQMCAFFEKVQPNVLTEEEPCPIDFNLLHSIAAGSDILEPLLPLKPVLTLTYLYK